MPLPRSRQTTVLSHGLFTMRREELLVIKCSCLEEVK